MEQTIREYLEMQRDKAVEKLSPQGKELFMQYRTGKIEAKDAPEITGVLNFEEMLGRLNRAQVKLENYEAIQRTISILTRWVKNPPVY